MRKFLTSKKLLITFLLFLIALEATFYFKPQEQIKLDIAEQRNYWREKIKQMGAQKAYDLFKKESQKNSPQRQHRHAHIFGELLYDTEGTKGIVVCDLSFSFGCYHSFFGRAITDKGDKIVKDLNEECIKKYGPYGTGCQHGIGHGLTEYLGPSRLDEALEVCLKIQSLTYLGCSSGVFMEYYFSTVIGDENILIQRRDLDKNNPFYPCEEVRQYKKSCYFELGQWLGRDPVLDLQEMGKLCQNIINEENRQSCFMGLGNTIGPDANYDIKKSLEKCKKMPDTEGQTLCLAGLAWSFYANPDTRNGYQTVCDDLATDKRKVCIDKADLTKDSIVL